MSMPYAITRPATPRNDAALRYSPLIAEAFHVVDTVREATRKSEVVRDSRIPHRPMELVAMTTQTIAVVAAAWFMSNRSSGVVDQVSVVLLVALGLPDVHPAACP